jgi:putative FmdB family regulatory protein
MPIYRFECSDCGVFERLRPMSQWRRRAACPGCGASRPPLVSAPHIRSGRSATRFKIEERNERSAFEPKLVQHVGRKNQDLEDQGYTKHRNRRSHDHGHGHDHSKTRHSTAHRPWMVGH